MCAALAGAALAVQAGPQGATLYGHRAYAMAKPAQLVSVGPYRSSGLTVKLLPPAAEAFREMQEAARRAGLGIEPISGYRGLSLQKYLFDQEVKRSGSAAAAARTTAPPGYSEHHTGLAIDLGDHAHPECDVKPCFQKTRTFEWLSRNAARFGFELSFAKDGGPVEFEPWHWRFVGDPASAQVFESR